MSSIFLPFVGPFFFRKRLPGSESFVKTHMFTSNIFSQSIRSTFSQTFQHPLHYKCTFHLSVLEPRLNELYTKLKQYVFKLGSGGPRL